MIHVRQGPRVWRNLTLLEVFLDMLLHGAQPHLHELFGQLLVLLSVAGKLRIFEASKACFLFREKARFFKHGGCQGLDYAAAIEHSSCWQSIWSFETTMEPLSTLPTKVWGHAALADCGGNLRLGPEIVGSKVIQSDPNSSNWSIASPLTTCFPVCVGGKEGPLVTADLPQTFISIL